MANEQYLVSLHAVIKTSLVHASRLMFANPSPSLRTSDFTKLHGPQNACKAQSPSQAALQKANVVLSMHNRPCSWVAGRREVSPLASGGDRSAVALAIARPASAEMQVLKQFLLQAAELAMTGLTGRLW